MKKEDVHIKVLYNWMMPERMLENLRVSQDIFHRYQGLLAIHADSVSRECYNHCARFCQNHLSEDELNQYFNSLNQEQGWNVFSLLAEYGRRVLDYPDNEPLCKQQHILEWNRMTHDLGQDLFTCSLRAKEDAERRLYTQYFSWVPILRSDDRHLMRIMQTGLSENHFHLNGSLEVFALAWGFLMNHPNEIEGFFSYRYFNENRQARYTQGEKDNQLPWKTRLYYAAWIRAHLFQKMQTAKENPDDSDSFLVFDRSWDKRSMLVRMVERLRFLYGYHFPQLNKKPACLDYAITTDRYANNKGSYRFLAGERGFLYECFRGCFSGKFNTQEKDLFYLYLLIQIQLRQEMVQTNELIGFSNFSDYQDRKAWKWGDRDEYWAEGRRMAINGALHGNVDSLELRVMPRDSVKKLQNNIEADDALVEFFEEEIQKNKDDFDTGGRKPIADLREQQDKYFYVLHFAKGRDGPVKKPDFQIPIRPRNDSVRNRIHKQAVATAHALQRNQKLCTRIRGIDACSHEIGCRPETFATEFRYLRGAILNHADGFLETRYWPSLGATYHVGEDFLDLTDGLRAIEECVRYLGLKRNDRLGHALALGIEPAEYYQLKGKERILPKQDALDDLVWLLRCCIKWEISMPNVIWYRMKQEAEQLLKELYGPVQYEIFQGKREAEEITLQDYYNSWKLRGDHPEIYNAFYEVPDEQFCREMKLLRKGPDKYRQFEITPDGFELTNEEQLDQLREKHVVRKLLRQYHYDYQTRELGQEPYVYSVSEELIPVLRTIQNKMMLQLAEIGIGVECNPSSNKLIGTFGSYEKHPIFRFNHYGLSYPGEQDMNEPQLCVSINTDDQGVFGTSLENEYALVMGALQEKKDNMGQRLYNDDDILFYLEHVRRQGDEMTFPNSQVRRMGRYGIR